MPLSRRYSPEHPPGEKSNYAYDFSFIVPPGIGITAGELTVWSNVVPPVLSSDFTIGPVSVLGRVCYASLTGGVEGRDYQVRWKATDTEGNIWPRTGLVLCAQTS